MNSEHLSHREQSRDRTFMNYNTADTKRVRENSPAAP